MSNQTTVMIVKLLPMQLSWAANQVWYRRRMDYGGDVKQWVLDAHLEGHVPQNLVGCDLTCHAILEARKMSVKFTDGLWRATITTKTAKYKSTGKTLNEAILRAYVMEGYNRTSMDSWIQIIFLKEK